MTLVLSTSDRARLTRALEALLSPLEHDHASGWAREACRSMKDLLGADKATLVLPAEAPPLFFSEEVSAEILKRYPRTVRDSIPTRWAVWKRQVDLGAWSRSLIHGPRLPDYYRTEYYNEYIRLHRGFDAVGLSAPLSEEPEFGTIAQMLFHHDRPRGPKFGEKGLNLLRVTFPAYRAGVKLRHRLASARARLASTLDALGEALRLYDMDGRLLHQTPAFTRLLKEHVAPGRITQGADRAARSISTVHRGGQDLTGAARRASDVSIRTPGGSCTIAACLLGESLSGRPLALVSVAQDIRRLPDRRTVVERLSLTPRQAEVALLVAEGMSDKRVAKSLGISPHTARHHVEALLGRLGLHSRRDVRDRLLDQSRSPRPKSRSAT